MNESYIANYLLPKINNPYGVAGLMGNLYAESGLKFNVVERLCIKRLKENGKGDWTDETYTQAVDDGTISREEFLHPLPNKVYGFGAVQWTTVSRKAGLYDLCKSKGVSIADPETQLEYLMYELANSYPTVLKVLKSATSVREASDIVLDRFECPADRSETVRVKRASYGQKYYDEYLKEMRPVGTLQGLINRAYEEQGYIEKASNANLDSKSTNKGDKNYTKYARDVNNAGLRGCQGQAWCCTYQFWLELMEFGVDEALRHWHMTKETYVGYNCFSTFNVFKAAGMVGTEPRLGAMPIFTFSHAGRCVRIYEKNGRKMWSCAEGNTSSDLSDRNGGQVVIKEREWNDPTVKGFCYIDYEDHEPQQKIVEGWQRSADGRWWYQNADGSYPSNGWAYLHEVTGNTDGWYLMDEQGYMLTGAQVAPDGKLYYLCDDESSNRYGQCMVTDDKGALYNADWNQEDEKYIR